MRLCTDWTYVVGTCTIGQQQSPINIPLADHLAQTRVASSEKKHESAGVIKFQFEQSTGNGKDVKFNFEQQIEKSANTKFKFEQKVEEFGDIKFGFEANLYEQKLDKFGDINFHYDNQSGAAVSNPGHGTPQVSQNWNEHNVHVQGIVAATVMVDYLGLHSILDILNDNRHMSPCMAARFTLHCMYHTSCTVWAMNEACKPTTK